MNRYQLQKRLDEIVYFFLLFPISCVFALDFIF